ncbi:trimethylguanosine synthase [Spatholobus suberectus]|nr:trimethylguanosine synthase [Spatholobus suberectus]
MGVPDYAKATTYDMKTMLRPHDGWVVCAFKEHDKLLVYDVQYAPLDLWVNQDNENRAFVHLKKSTRVWLILSTMPLWQGQRFVD